MVSNLFVAMGTHNNSSNQGGRSRLFIRMIEGLIQYFRRARLIRAVGF
jgi:hypothetical protein